jgi:hypothetical protein
MSGAFTIDSSTPTLRINLNEHPIFKHLIGMRKWFWNMEVIYDPPHDIFIQNFICGGYHSSIKWTSHIKKYLNDNVYMACVICYKACYEI